MFNTKSCLIVTTDLYSALALGVSHAELGQAAAGARSRAGHSLDNVDKHFSKFSGPSLPSAVAQSKLCPTKFGIKKGYLEYF